MLVGNTSFMTINANVLFDDVSKFTIEAWIQPSTLPSGGSVILDVIAEYGLSINPSGTLTCTVEGPGGDTTTGTVSVGQWTHVACTYDGATEVIYINGSVAAMRNVSGAIANGANGMGIAAKYSVTYPSNANLIGLIDQLRLLNVARTAAEICADAGKTSCP